MSNPVFGDFITDWDAEQALVAHLRAWMPDYLPNARRKGEARRAARDLPPFADFPLPKSYPITPRDPEKWPEDQLPAIMIVSTGISDTPRSDGDGLYRGVFQIGVASICSAGAEDTSKQLAGLYFGAAAGILLDKPSLGGFAESTTFAEGIPTDWLSTTRDRSIASRYAVFNVEVKGLFTVTGGPDDHLEDPDTDPGDRPTVDTHELTLEKT